MRPQGSDVAREAMAVYLREVHALLSRQEALTRAMVDATEAYLGGALDREALAEVALGQLGSYMELEADAHGIVAPRTAAIAHALYCDVFSGCADAQRTLLRAIDVRGFPDLSGFAAPAELLRTATDTARMAADALLA